MKTLQNKLLACLSAIALLLAASCTHNNGDIGPWFGMWQVEEITVDGAPAGDYVEPCLFFAFQGTVANVKFVMEGHEAVDAFGSWSESEDKSMITIVFPDENLLPPTISRLEKTSVLRVESMNARRATLLMTTSHGSKVRYSLKHIF